MIFERDVRSLSSRPPGTDGGEACAKARKSCDRSNATSSFISDMKILKPRSRMISVRLSEEEYTALIQLCSATGARSVSDFTRDAMRILLNSAHGGNASSTGLGEFRVQLRELNERIEHLTEEITMLKAGGSQ